MPFPDCCPGPGDGRLRCVPCTAPEDPDVEQRAAHTLDGHARMDPPDGWSERDWQILLELARGDDALVGFQGLKRRLDLHPEALRRSLARLVESGEVEKLERGGYRLTEVGHDRVAGAPVPRVSGPPVTVAGFLLPSLAPPAGIAERFAGRWFDGLYWYGVEPADAETTLTWLTPGDVAVRLRVGMGVAAIEVRGCAEPDARIAAAAPLVAAVAEWLRAHETTPGAAS